MSDTVTSSKMSNQSDLIYKSKRYLIIFAVSIKRKLGISSPFPASQSFAPPVNAKVVKLEQCKEEFDNTTREAKFALLSTDLVSLASTTSQGGSHNSSSDTTTNQQHWDVIVHFPRGNKNYLFRGWKDENGLVQSGRAEGVDYELFVKAKYFGTVETSPRELLAKAQQASETEYRILENNCQRWTKEFLRLISPELLTALYIRIPATETHFGYVTRTLKKFSIFVVWKLPQTVTRYLTSAGAAIYGYLITFW